MASGNNFGGGNPRQMRPQPTMNQPRNMMRGPSGDDIRSGYTPRPQTTQSVAAPSGPSALDLMANPMAGRAAMAQQRRNRMFGAAQSPFNQFTGGAQYIGAASGDQLGDPALGQGVLYDYGNGQYKFGTGQNDLRDIYGNWTFLRS